MAYLKIRKNSVLIQEVNLNSQQTYLVGRGETCQIRLDPEVGISRQHLEISYTSSGWALKVLSRYGELYVDGRKSSGFTMQGNTHFSVPPYDFDFFTQENEFQSPSNSSHQDEFERTLVSELPSKGYLKLIDSTGKQQQVFRLEGESWTAGCDIACNLFIDSQKISLKQFEIYHERSHYFIRDLDSSNGTLVNAHLISQTEWTELKSGDVIAIADLTLQFELKDPSFQERMDSIELPFQRPPPHFQQRISSTPSFTENAWQVNDYAFGGKQKNQFKLNSFSLIILIFFVIVAGTYFVLKYTALIEISLTKDVPLSHQPKKPFDNLAPEEQQIVMQSYGAALTRMERQEFTEALQEIARIKKRIPTYENSDSLEKNAKQSLEEIESLKQKEQLEQAEKEMEAKIQKQINEEYAAARKIEEERIRETNAATNRLKSLYDQAVKLEKKEKFLEAIVAYKIVETSKFIEPHDLKEKSAVARIGLIAKMARNQKRLSLTADELTKKGNYKEAIITLREALKINPENETINAHLSQVFLDLRKQFQSIYQESIIEESVGNVDSAKEKWQRIIDQSFSGEDYFEKARLKLKKYP